MRSRRVQNNYSDGKLPLDQIHGWGVPSLGGPHRRVRTRADVRTIVKTQGGVPSCQPRLPLILLLTPSYSSLLSSSPFPFLHIIIAIFPALLHSSSSSRSPILSLLSSLSVCLLF